MVGRRKQKPLAIAVIGGLSFSTLFTLVLAPLLYVSVRRWRNGRPALSVAADGAVAASELRTQ